MVANENQSADRAVVEPLENRTLMTADDAGVIVDFESKTIDVSGTAAADNIHVVLHGTKLLVQVGEEFTPGEPVEYVTIYKNAAYKVKTIILDGKAGDDTLIVGTDIRIKATFLGGEGDDILIGGGGNDRMFGDEGNDVMDGNRGHDHMRGGDDDDAMRGDSGNDTLIGNKGLDLLDGERGNDMFHTHDNENNDFIFGGPGYDIGEVDTDSLDMPEGLALSLISLEEFTPHKVE